MTGQEAAERAQAWLCSNGQGWRDTDREVADTFAADVLALRGRITELERALAETREYAWNAQWDAAQRLKAIDATVQRALAASGAASEQDTG